MTSKPVLQIVCAHIFLSIPSILISFKITCFSTTFGSMSGTRRMENLPMTLRGMTVLAPASAKAPSIPWSEREGYLQRCMRICSCKRKCEEFIHTISGHPRSLIRKRKPYFGAVQQLFHSDILAVFIQIKINFLIQALLFLCDRCHTVIHPRNHDLSPFVHKGACFRKDH